MKKYPLFSLVVTLTLLGAGCLPWSRGTEPQGAAIPEAEASKQEATSTIGSGEAEIPESKLVELDETWRAFHSNSGFSFRYPTKGALTPEWEVVRFKADDEAIKDGCVNLGSGGLGSKSEFVGFCHTHSIIEMPDIYSLDYYTMKMGDGYLAIKFTKQLASIEGCSFYSVNKNSCVPFNEDDYRAMLDTSISTFKFDK